MKKSIQILCKQNSTINIPCGNCKEKTEVKTVELFKEAKYKLLCPHCNETTNVDTTKFVVDFEKQLKSMGVKW